jgi:hypothetical protein
VISFNKPENLNGSELRQELLEAGVSISQSISAISVEADGRLYLDIMPQDEAKATSVVAGHNGTIIPPQPTIENKLQAAGLTVNELKQILGLS